MKLMIIDQQAEKRDMIRNFLNLSGITICECTSSDEALTRAREFKPDWITLAVNLLGSDGFQSATALREAHPPAQIVILNDYSEMDFQKLYNLIGRSALFQKKSTSIITNSARLAQRPEGKTKFRKRTLGLEESSDLAFA